MNNSFFETNKHGFQENKHYVFKKNKFSLYFLFTALKVCWKFIANFQSNFQGGCKFDWNFQCKLAGLDWKFQCKLSNLDWNLKKLAGLHWKFAWKFQCSLQVSLNFQSSLESLHWNFQSSLQVCIWKFQSNLQPPLKIWLKVCNKLSTNLQGSKQKI